MTLKDFQPTAEQINALPERLRLYVHDLETLCDPAGEVAALALTRDENAMLRAKVAELEKAYDSGYSDGYNEAMTESELWE